MNEKYAKHFDVTELEKAIKNGELGENLAKRVQNFKQFKINIIRDSGIDYRLFTFNDQKSGYTILIDKDKLVLLCKGRSGGHANNFVISNKSGHKVLYFEYSTGLGSTQKIRGEYNLGSGKSLVSDNN